MVVGGVEDKKRLNELWDVPEDAILNLDAGRDYTADNLYFRFSGYILSYILAGQKCGQMNRSRAAAARVQRVCFYLNGNS